MGVRWRGVLLYSSASRRCTSGCTPCILLCSPWDGKTRLGPFSQFKSSTIYIHLSVLSQNMHNCLRFPVALRGIFWSKGKVNTLSVRLIINTINTFSIKLIITLVQLTGPALAHEMRYPGGDCTSDIWTDIYDDSIVGVKPAVLPARI